jgi:Ca-activated chloride channel family protein
MKMNLGLENEDGKNVALKSVHLDGTLEGLLLRMKVRQRYLNDSDHTIEATYTFPASWGANLMDLCVELNGKRMQAVALPKKNAEKKYEDAIESGDTPVMLEKSRLGLYTANLGNLKAGEEAIIEIEYAQLLRFEKGHIRITVPTVISERYGDSTSQGHLAAHQSVDTDLLAEYAFTAKIDVFGKTSNAAMTCPSHKIKITSIENGKRIELKNGGVLDRDFIVVLDDLQSESFVTTSHDDENFASVASFCPVLQEQPPKPVALKILVDCSGSMQGESMQQAQEALYEMSLRLHVDDFISYSKFGSNVIHTTNQLEQCSEKYIKQVLAPAILRTQADLGGTELNKALHSTFKLSFAKAYIEGCDLLLITDGNVWDIEEIITQAKISNHRIFAIGVGSAPAESLLRELADQTGGACELVTPNESISAAVLRMLDRMRSTRTTYIGIDWGGDVIWQSTLPKQVFSNETIHVFAQLKDKPQVTPRLNWTIGESLFSATPKNHDWDASGAAARLTASSKLKTTSDETEATELALKHQLASKFTNLLLIHIREEAQKASNLPELQKINQMQAAGLGGFGQTKASQIRYSVSANVLRVGTDGAGFPAQPSYDSMSSPSVWRTNKTKAAQRVKNLSTEIIDDYEIPAFLRKKADQGPLDKTSSKFKSFNEDNCSPNDLLEKFNYFCLSSNDFSAIAANLMGEIIEGRIWKIICEVSESTEQVDLYWACLLNWISNDVAGIVSTTRHSQRLLNAELSKYDKDLKKLIEVKFKNSFSNISKTSWGLKTEKNEHLLIRKIKKLLFNA